MKVWCAKSLQSGKITIRAKLFTCMPPHGILSPQPTGDVAEYVAKHPAFELIPDPDAPTPEPEEIIPPVSENSESDAPDLGAMSYARLKTFGKKLGVKHTRGMARGKYEAAVRAALED